MPLELSLLLITLLAFAVIAAVQFVGYRAKSADRFHPQDRRVPGAPDVLCIACGQATAIETLPSVERPVIENRHGPHVARVYGSEMERQIVFGRGPILLCYADAVASFRKLERFHADQRAEQNQLTAKHADEASTYETRGVVSEIQGEYSAEVVDE